MIALSHSSLVGKKLARRVDMLEKSREIFCSVKLIKFIYCSIQVRGR